MLNILFFLNLIYLVSIKAKQTINIMEDLPIGTSIYKFSTNGCKTSASHGTYRFVDNQKNFNDFFLIDPYTGRVTTKKLIDRDEFCLRHTCSCSRCEITLEVLCVNLGQIYFNDLSIIIDDRNDHSPQFSKSSITIDILENIPIGYVIPIDTAIDIDYGNNSIQGYKLFEDNTKNLIENAFQIEYSKKTDLLSLRLMKTLDRELHQSLEYTIQAYDGGQPQVLSGYLNIYINILDVNDMSPIFNRSNIHLVLSESTSIGSLITQVHAYDNDTDINGLVYYTIVSIDPPSNGTFRLEKETGSLYLDKDLDYEKEKFYRIKVKAQDNGPQQGSQPAFIYIDVDVKDENDNYPLITATFNDDKNIGIEYIPNSRLIKIRENILEETFLGHVSITDLDKGNNGRVNWSINSNGSLIIKKLFNNEAFLMFTSHVFDREQQPKYEINVKAYDYGIPSLTSSLDFTLIILDENDNVPKFDKNFYIINITETTSIQTIVYQFHATDDDQINTPNSQIRYKLSDENVFSINSNTGELRLIIKVDREINSKYEFDITAYDHGQPQSLSSTVHCIINIIDVNDNYPIFDLSQYVFEIPETLPYYSPIGYVHATDADEYYGELTYTLAHNETTMTDKWPFELTSNGTLYLKRTSAGIDYERQSIYKFSILAIDNNGFNTSVPVLIHILNRNDNCPKLINHTIPLFYNIDVLNNNNSNETLSNYYLQIFDNDNDTCTMELLNFNDIFQIKYIKRNLFLLDINKLPRQEHYVLQFRLRDLINETIDQSCIQYVRLVVTIGTNQTNKTLAMKMAQEYIKGIHFQSQRIYSHFNFKLLNIILILILFLFIILIIFVSTKLNILKKRKLRKNSNTLYRLQAQTETQLPLLNNGPGEQSLTSSLIVSGNSRYMQNDNLNHSLDDSHCHQEQQKQRLRYQLHPNKSKTNFNSNDFQTFALNTKNRTYDLIHSGTSSSSSYPHMRDSGYETTTSSNLEQQSFFSPPTNVSKVNNLPDEQLQIQTYYSSPLSSSNNLSRTLRTFSNLPTTNDSGNGSSTIIISQLVEQTAIEV